MLLRTLRRAPVFVLGTYRDDEVPGYHPLRALVAELGRLSGPVRVSNVELHRFDVIEARQQIEGILGDAAPDRLVHNVFVRSEGNPFLVEELLATADGAELPETLRDILLSRSRDLPAAALPVLRMVAVAGRAVAHALLMRAVDVAQDDLAAVLRVAVDRHVLVSTPDGYWFRHALVAEALLAETLPGERIPLHRRLADALEVMEPSAEGSGGPTARSAQRLAELAHHRFAARDFEAALVVSVAAGLAAERVFAQAEALRHFVRAIELWPVVPVAHARVALDLVGLQQRAAEVANLIGDTERAITLVRDAIGGTDDPARKGLLHERHARYLWMAASPVEVVIDAYRQAVGLVPDRPSRERARVLAGLASALMLDHRFRESRAVAEQTLEAARAAGARAEEAHALATLGQDLLALGDVDAGVDHLRTALALARASDMIEDLPRSYINLSDALRATGNLAEAATVALDGLASAERYGSAPAHGDSLVGNAIDALFLQGRWAEALVLTPDRPTASGYATPAAMLSVAATRVFIAAGRFGPTRRRIWPRCPVGSRAATHAELRLTALVRRAELALARGRPAEALRHLDGAAVAPDEARGRRHVGVRHGGRPACRRGPPAGGRCRRGVRRRTERAGRRTLRGLGSPRSRRCRARRPRRSPCTRWPGRSRPGRRIARTRRPGRQPRRRGTTSAARTTGPTRSGGRPKRCCATAAGAARRNSGSHRPRRSRRTWVRSPCAGRSRRSRHAPGWISRCHPSRRTPGICSG